ncbi:MAG TPA: radical SAM protein [Gammaproteobacteria bacterium]|nr:radical SAM protein [Gammaproteobacteria bacterium]
MNAPAESITDTAPRLYRYEQLRIVHLELTHRCNAACPMCARNIHGGALNPDMPLDELSLEDIRKILLPDFVRQLKRIYACGNYGDPIVARDCLSVFRYLRENGPDLNLDLHTNGSARRPDWWRELAETMKAGPHYLRFGIDGLADTNHLYRRGADWNTVMRSAEAFIAAGGRAEWDFLVFRHNEHQVEEARRLAREMGFAEFFVRKTGRFLGSGDLQTMERFDVRDRDGNFEYWLEQPENPDYLNPAYDDLDRVRRQYGSYQSYLDGVGIDCKVAGAKGKIYLSAQGYLLPCCWLGAVFSEASTPERRQFAELVEGHGGSEALNARTRGLRSVVESELFQRAIPASWDCNSVADGKLAICARTCGKDYDPLDRQRG